MLTGRGAFVRDIGFPRQLHMRVVRSPYANAVLRSVNVTTALAAPGIVAVWTAADIADLPPIDFRDPAAEALRVGVRWGIPEPWPTSHLRVQIIQALRDFERGWVCGGIGAGGARSRLFLRPLP